MIENVEELRPELQPVAFSKMEALGDGEIEVLESGILEHVASHVSELAQGWREHDRVALRVAPKERERFGGCTWTAAIKRESLIIARGVAAGIARHIIPAKVRNPNAPSRFEVRRLTVETPANGRGGRRTYG